MNGHPSARRSTRALVLLGFAVLTSLGFRAWNDGHAVPKKLPMISTMALPADEIADLAKVAEWLGQSPADRMPAAELVAQIRKDRESFNLFASFHSEQERRQALVDVPYGKEIAKAAKANAVDSFLVASVVEIESTFRPDAGSHKGAVGLMQLLPSTAGMSRAKLKNPNANLEAGAKYLAKMIDRFDGDLGLALAAYNAGPTNVRRYNGVPPFPETEQYVEKVLSRYVDYHRELWQTSGAAQLVAASVAS